MNKAMNKRKIHRKKTPIIATTIAIAITILTTKTKTKLINEQNNGQNNHEHAHTQITLLVAQYLLQVDIRSVRKSHESLNKEKKT